MHSSELPLPPFTLHYIILFFVAIPSSSPYLCLSDFPRHIFLFNCASFSSSFLLVHSLIRNSPVYSLPFLLVVPLLGNAFPPTSPYIFFLVQLSLVFRFATDVDCFHRAERSRARERRDEAAEIAPRACVHAYAAATARIIVVGSGESPPGSPLTKEAIARIP